MSWVDGHISCVQRRSGRDYCIDDPRPPAEVHVTILCDRSDAVGTLSSSSDDLSVVAGTLETPAGLMHSLERSVEEGLRNPCENYGRGKDRSQDLKRSCMVVDSFRSKRGWLGLSGGRPFGLFQSEELFALHRFSIPNGGCVDGTTE